MNTLSKLKKPKSVKIPLGDEAIYMRSLTATEFLDLKSKSSNEDATFEERWAFNLELLAKVLLNEDGSQAVQSADELNDVPTELVQLVLLPAAMEVSGFGEKKV